MLIYPNMVKVISDIGNYLISLSVQKLEGLNNIFSF